MKQNVHVIGAGLLGGSIALALSEAGWSVSIEDQTPERTEKSLESLAISNPERDDREIDVVVIAVPISANKKAILDAFRRYENATIIEISSVKTNSLPDIHTNNSDNGRFVSTHPFAGKEVHGAEHASVDLFQNRVWAICCGSYLSPNSKHIAEHVIRDCGAVAIDVELSEHDNIVGFTSHLPQLLSTLLSIQMEDLPENALIFSGNGLRDMTRLAMSSSEIWSEIVISNAENLSEILRNLTLLLNSLQHSLEAKNPREIQDLFQRGIKQKLRMPGKHGDLLKDYAKIEVQILDQPGELSRIFAVALENNVNIEDVRINHTLGRNLAILEIYVSPDVAVTFKETLLSNDWKVRGNLAKGEL